MSQIRRTIALIGATMLMALSLVPVAQAGTYFNDVADTSEFAPYINALAADGIVSGVNGNYYPFLLVTRAELTKFANGGAGLPMNIAAGAPHFGDVPGTHTLYNHVEAAFANGVVQGRAPGVFAPDAPVLRQEAAKIIVRTFRAVDTNNYFVENTTGGPSFSDVSASSEFYGDIQTLYNLGIINGYGNGMFGPMDPTRRDQMAKIVSRARDVLRNGPPAVVVGAPARLKVEADDDELYSDGYSSTTITATVLDGANNVSGGYMSPVTCETTLGTLVKGTADADEGDDSVTVSADSGRAQFTLYSADEEGTATITCETGNLDEGVVQVDFSEDAPRVRNGFGSSHEAGVGTIELIITDDKILTSPTTDDLATDFTQVPGGCALVEVYTYNDEGEPMTDHDILLSVTGGTADLSDAADTVCGGAAPDADPTRSVRVTTDDNGRAVAFIQTLDDQQEGMIEITATDRDTSPTLQTDAELEFVNLELVADVFPDEAITTRNDTQITADDGEVYNIALVWVLVRDENGDPITDDDVHDLRARFTGGQTSGAALQGCDDAACIAGGVADAGADGDQFMVAVVDSDGDLIPGLYVIKVLAGESGGSLELTITDETAVGEPEVVVDIDVAEPELDCFGSAEEVDEDSNVAIICRLTTEDGVPIPDEVLECQVQSGDGGVDVAAADGGTVVGDGPVDMEAVEDETGSAGTGWYWCQYESDDSVSGDQSITVRITDTDRAELPAQTVSVTETDDNPGSVSELVVEPLATNLGPEEVTSVLVIVQDDDGAGIEAMELETTCAVALAGDPGRLCTPDSGLENMEITEDLVELSGGAYFFDATSENVNGRGEVEVEMNNGADIPVDDEEVPFNIVDDEVTAVATRDDILVDEGFGVVACVADENGDPVDALVAADFTVTNLGVTTDESDVEELLEDDGAGLVGSGCYAFSVDTASDVQPGDDVEIRVAVIGGPTNPQDTVEVAVEDVELELMAHPDFTDSANCMVITGVIRDQDGDPVLVTTPADDGIELEVSDGSGELSDDSIADADCDGDGDTVLEVTADSDGTGVYVATFEADVIEEDVEVTGRVQGANSRAEDSVSLSIN